LNRRKCEDRFARLVHRFDICLETLRGRSYPKLPVSPDNNGRTCNRSPTNTGDKGGLLSSYRANPDSVRLPGHTFVADIDHCAAAKGIRVKDRAPAIAD